MSGLPSPSTSPRATPPPCARWRFQRALSRVTLLVKRTPVREGGSSLNPERPPAATLSSRQRYPASSCHAEGGAARRHAAASASSARLAARSRDRRGQEASRRADERRACLASTNPASSSLLKPPLRAVDPRLQQQLLLDAWPLGQHDLQGRDGPR